MPDTDLLAWVVELSTALRAARIPHALAGGLALAVHGHPRATTDIDFVLASDEASIASARRVLAELGLLQTRRAIVKFKRLSMLRVIIPPGASPEPVSVDLLLTDPDVLDVLGRSIAVRVSGKDVAVVSPEDLVLLKLLRSSDQDLVDIRALAETAALDRAYLAAHAKRLRITARLSRALPPRLSPRRRR